MVGQASDQAIRTSRAGVAAGHRRTHQLQGIRGPNIDWSAEPSHSGVTTTNRGGTNSASQPQASQHEPYRSLRRLVPNIESESSHAGMGDDFGAHREAESLSFPVEDWKRTPACTLLAYLLPARPVSRCNRARSSAGSRSPK